ncbi:MAG: hypothetical protein SGCHY_001379 [Lobulomycetales sp.]
MPEMTTNTMSASDEKALLLLQSQTPIVYAPEQPLPAYSYKTESSSGEGEERVDKSLIMHLVVCTACVTMSMWFYAKLVLKCVNYLSDSSSVSDVHYNECIGIMVASLAISGVVFGMFVHAMRQTLRLVEKHEKAARVPEYREIVITV